MLRRISLLVFFVSGVFALEKRWGLQGTSSTPTYVPTHAPGSVTYQQCVLSHKCNATTSVLANQVSIQACANSCWLAVQSDYIFYGTSSQNCQCVDPTSTCTNAGISDSNVNTYALWGAPCPYLPSSQPDCGLGGYQALCQQNPTGPCCSMFGYCGAGSEYCSTSNSCQAGYGYCGDNPPMPSQSPTSTPTLLSANPSAAPSQSPTQSPTTSPSLAPSTVSPTTVPPSRAPSVYPTVEPSQNPTPVPTTNPSQSPTAHPSVAPTAAPSQSPSQAPTVTPSLSPTASPTLIPSAAPSLTPTKLPTLAPTAAPTAPLVTPGSISATLLSQTLVTQRSYANLLTALVTVSSVSMAKFVIIEPVLLDSHQVAVTASSQLFVPQRVNVSLAMAPLSTRSYTFSLTAIQTVGNYSIGLRVSPDSIADYVIEKNLTALMVQSPSDPLPAPVLLSATFSNDGTSLSVIFSSEVNETTATLNGAEVFSCDRLLHFPCDTTAQCLWNSASSVTVMLPLLDNCVKPGNLLSLSPEAKLKSRCPLTTINNEASCPNYQSWKCSNTSQAVMVSNAASPVIPSVVVATPPSIGPCTDLPIDLSLTTGSGGRSWNSASISVTASDESNVTSLQAYLNHHLQFQAPINVKASALKVGVTYTFQVLVCNFLGSCGQSANSKVVVATKLIPLVQIIGGNPVVLTRSQKLSLQSAVSFGGNNKSCNQGASSNSSSMVLQYNWTIALNGSQNRLMNLTSISGDRSQYLLPAFSLHTNTLYYVSLKVSVGSVSSLTTLSVWVQRGSIIGRIAGGSAQNIRRSGGLVLDGSTSYDEDTGGTTGLSFSWSCYQTSPVLNDSCGALFAPFSSSASQQQGGKLSLIALPEAEIGASAMIALEVSDPLSGRTSAPSAVAVTIISALAPLISLTSSATTINQDDTLLITASIAIPANFTLNHLNTTWQSSSSSLELAALSTYPVRREINVPFASSQSYVLSSSLFLPAGILSAGVAYTFSLQASVHQQVLSVGSMVIAVNSPPQPGVFIVQPLQGREAMDPFDLVCVSWVDSNLPLSYQFSYVEPSSSSGGGEVNKNLVQASSLLSYANGILLPSGLFSTNFSLTLVADVYDSLSADTIITTSVRVIAEGGGAAATSLGVKANRTQSLLSNAISQATTSGNLNLLLQAVSLSTSILNLVNCSATPSCAALNRFNCSSTAYTCGSCLSADFIGEVGDSNTPCYRVEEWNAQLTGGGGGPMKVCANNCSSHGQCTFQSSATGEVLSTCDMSDPRCGAVCVCDLGYFGVACQNNEEDVGATIASQNLLIAATQTIAQSFGSNPSASSISLLIQSIGAVTATTPLSSDGISALRTLITQTMQLAKTSNIPLTVLVTSYLSALNSLDQLLEAEQLVREIGGGPSRKRRQLVSSLTSTIASIISALSQSNVANPISSAQTMSTLASLGRGSSATSSNSATSTSTLASLASNALDTINSGGALNAQSAANLLSILSVSISVPATARVIRSEALADSPPCEDMAVFSVALSPLEQLLGTSPSFAKLPLCEAITRIQEEEGGGDLTVLGSIVSVNYDTAGKDNNTLTSNPISVRLVSPLPCANDLEHCQMEVTFIYHPAAVMNAKQVLLSNNPVLRHPPSPHNLTVICEERGEGKSYNQTIYCPTTDQNYTIPCSADRREKKLVTCPVLTILPDCRQELTLPNGIGVGGGIGGDCVVKSFTETNLTCLCPIFNTSSSSLSGGKWNNSYWSFFTAKAAQPHITTSTSSNSDSSSSNSSGSLSDGYIALVVIVPTVVIILLAFLLNRWIGERKAERKVHVITTTPVDYGQIATRPNDDAEMNL